MYDMPARSLQSSVLSLHLLVALLFIAFVSVESFTSTKRRRSAANLPEAAWPRPDLLSSRRTSALLSSALF